MATTVAPNPNSGFSFLLTRGRGRGRGRLLLKGPNAQPQFGSEDIPTPLELLTPAPASVPAPVPLEDEVDGSASRIGASVSVVKVAEQAKENAFTNGLREALPSLDDGRFADAEEDDRASASSVKTWKSVASASSVMTWKSVYSAGSMMKPALVGTYVNVPERLLEGGKVVLKLVSVDMAKMAGFVQFYDPSTQLLRKHLAQMINEEYKSKDASELKVAPEKVMKGEVYIVKDDEKKLHRAMLLKVHPDWGFKKFVDVDTCEQFVVKKALQVYEMTSEIAEVWFQGVACKFEFSDSAPVKSWLEANEFIMRDAARTQKVLLSSMEVVKEKPFVPTKIEKMMDEMGMILRVQVDIFQTRHLKNTFIHSLLFHTIPRLPNIGETKIAFITNVLVNGNVDVIFVDQLFDEIQNVLKTVQVKNRLFGPWCEKMSDFFLNMVCSFNARLFVAAADNNWTGLHRLKILGSETDRHGIQCLKVLYLDSGKQTTMPMTDLCNLGVPVNAHFIPELLEMIPPQAVTLGISNMQVKDKIGLLEYRQFLEGMPCYIRTVSNEDSMKPLADLFVASKGQVKPLLDIVRESAKTDLELTPVEMVKFEEKNREVREISRNLTEGPLKRFGDKLVAIKEKNRNAIAEAKTKLGNRKCECCKKYLLAGINPEQNIYDSIDAFASTLKIAIFHGPKRGGI